MRFFRLEKLTLILAAIFLTKLLMTNEVALLIHPRYFWMIKFSFVVIMIVLFFDRSQSKIKNKKLTILLNLFLIGGTLIELQPLSAFTESGQSLTTNYNIDDYSKQKRTTNFSLNSEDLTLEDWITRFSLDPEPSHYTGQKVKVSGFYMTDATGRPMIARQIINCCAADARIIGIWLTKPLNYKENTWFEVEGTMSIIEEKDFRSVAIEVKKHQEIEPPDNPYVTN